MLRSRKKISFVATSASKNNSSVEETKFEITDLNAALESEMLLIGNTLASRHGQLITESAQNSQAIASGCQKMKALIKAGANPNQRGFDNFTPLLLAAFVGDLSLLKFLLKHPAVDLDAVNFEGQSVLHFVVSGNQVLQVLLVLQAISSDKENAVARINKKNNGGYVAIEYASHEQIGQNISKILLTEGADFDPRLKQLLEIEFHNQDTFKGVEQNFLNLLQEVSSLNEPVKKSLNKMLVILREMYLPQQLFQLEREAFEGLIEDVKNEFLQLATTPDEASELLRELLRMCQGLLVNVVQNHSSRPVQRNVKDLDSLKYPLELIARLVEKGANPNLQINSGFTALHFATHLNLPDIRARLIARGANPNIKDISGKLASDYSLEKILEVKSKSEAKPKAKPKAEEVIAEKTPEEKAQELQKLMLNLQASAENPRVLDKESEIKKMLALLEKSAVDVNFLTNKNYTALHLAARFGEALDVENLLAKNANINLETTQGNSVLNCAIAGKKNEVVKAVLQGADLDFAPILSEAKNAIAAKNQALVSVILSDEAVKQKFLNLDEARRKSCGEELRIAANKITKHANFKSIKASLEGLLSSRQSELKSDEIADFKISKNQLKKNRDAEKKAKKQQEEIEERNKKNVFEVKSEAREIAAETIENVAAKFAEIEQNFGKPSLQKRVDDRASDQTGDLVFEPHTNHPSPLWRAAPPSFAKRAYSPEFGDEKSYTELSPNAEEFLPPKEQMKKFLLGPRQINSVQDLPKFLQPILTEFLQNGCQVALKGSAAYLAPNAKKAPSDLDVEVTIGGIGKLPDNGIAKFVFEKFGLQILPENIFRKDGVFTLNVKDLEKKLDLSFYDSEMPPPQHLSWATNREPKIFFQPDGSAFCKEMSSPQLLVNPQAHGLILRLCFLETIGHLNREEIAAALASIAPTTPEFLLTKELKIYREDKVKSPEEIIFGYMQAHSFDKNEQKHFLSNLSWVLQISNSNSQKLAEHFSKIQEVLERSEPQKMTAANFQNTQKLSQNFSPPNLPKMW